MSAAPTQAATDVVNIEIDGVALTVAEVAADAFAVALVPHTIEATTLSALRPGQRVNLEADVLVDCPLGTLPLKKAAAQCVPSSVLSS